MNKFPFYKQLDSMLCGAACLQMIFEYYKLKSSQLHINTYCNAASEGISLLRRLKLLECTAFVVKCQLMNVQPGLCLAFVIGIKITLLSYIR